MNAHIIKGWNTALGFVEHFPSADPRSSCPSQTKKKKREYMQVQRVSSPLQMLQQVRQAWGLLHNGHLLSEFWSLEFWHQVFPLNPGTIQAVLPSPSYIQAQNLTVLPPTDVFWNAHSCLSVCPSVGPGVFGAPTQIPPPPSLESSQTLFWDSGQIPSLPASHSSVHALSSPCSPYCPQGHCPPPSPPGLSPGLQLWTTPC